MIPWEMVLKLERKAHCRSIECLMLVSEGLARCYIFWNFLSKSCCWKEVFSTLLFPKVQFSPSSLCLNCLDDLARVATCKLGLQEAAPCFWWDSFCVRVVLEVAFPETGVQKQAWVGKVVGTLEGQRGEVWEWSSALPTGSQDSSLAGALSFECFCRTVLIWCCAVDFLLIACGGKGSFLLLDEEVDYWIMVIIIWRTRGWLQL